MRILIFPAVVIFSLFGYSAGVSLKSGKSCLRKLIVLDLIIVTMMWAGLLYSQRRVRFSMWLFQLICIGVGLILGYLANLILGYSKATRVGYDFDANRQDLPEKNNSQAWRDFSYRIGAFQGQILLGFLYLILFAPVGLAVKFFSDPLKTKRLDQESYWVPKKTIALDIELYKKQG